MMEAKTGLRPPAIIADNVACLQQGADLVGRISADQYRVKNSQCFNSSIGEHVRHILDHFQCLIDGLEEDGGTGIRIDYDLRQRDREMEQDPARAIALIGRICTFLKGLDVEPGPGLEVKMDTGADRADQWAPSTLLRELQFLLSHTVHHYALIATMNTIAGIDTPEEFGIAPSTLAHHGKMSS